jgi:Ras GTPase-activating-like protein IQGAP2/3
MYGDTLAIGRRLNKHMPRIASGDAGDDWEADEPEPAPEPEVGLERGPEVEPEPIHVPVSPPMKRGEAVTPPQSTVRAHRTSAYEKLVSRSGSSSSTTPTPFASTSAPRPTRLRARSELNVNTTPTPLSMRARRMSAYEQIEAAANAPAPSPATIRRQTLPPPLALNSTDGTGSVDDVVGVPGRLRLSRNKSAPPTPIPTAKLSNRWGLWADTQRHLLHAYEYLCHVGEAKQWIEGCIGEELGLDVVEMDDGLRNGVVLAKLVRAIQGEAAVRRIYEVGSFPTWL